MVPPSASSKYPLRVCVAPVKAPFSCPKSSESMVPSGMAPQFTAMYLACLRWESAWMILGIASLPTPLSPVTNTEISVGATWMAFSMARLSFTSLPMISKRCLMDCTLSMGLVVFRVFEGLPEQGGRGAVLDLHHDKVPDLVVLFWKDHHGVLGVATHPVVP